MNNKKDFKKIAITYLIACLLLINLVSKNNKKDNRIKYAVNSTLEFDEDDLKSFIFESNSLLLEEKDYLFNKDFISDLLPFINSSLVNRIRFQKNLSNLVINKYENGDKHDNFAGYYSTLSPNEIFIKDYDKFDENKDTLAHEFVHLCQDLSCYNLISEACAEIISFEYYSENKINCYTTQVKLLKKLMEIIGADLIWNYSFTGNFKPIEDVIKPHLTNDEYSDFLNCLTFDYENKEENIAKFKRLDELISILYENIYKTNIEDNNIFYLIESDNSLVRYYFNKRLINAENSYYIDRYNKEFKRISYEEAINNNYFIAYSIKYVDLTKEEAQDLIKEEKYAIIRNIDFSKNNIIINRRTDKSYHTIITGIIDGIKYIDADIDELANNGIISIEYKLARIKLLTASEYLNKECEEGSTIYEIYSKKDMSLFDNYIEGYFPKKIFIEPFKYSRSDKDLT